MTVFVEAEHAPQVHAMSKICRTGPSYAAIYQFQRVGSLPHPLWHAAWYPNFDSPMGALDDAITALGVLGLVLQAVPLVGENLKAATELTAKICEQVKVRTFALARSHRAYRVLVL
jgi:hypothetical protein